MTFLKLLKNYKPLLIILLASFLTPSLSSAYEGDPIAQTRKRIGNHYNKYNRFDKDNHNGYTVTPKSLYNPQGNALLLLTILSLSFTSAQTHPPCFSQENDQKSIEPGLLANSSSSSCGNSSLNCEKEALKVGQQYGTRVTSLEKGFAHPGIFIPPQEAQKGFHTASTGKGNRPFCVVDKKWVAEDLQDNQRYEKTLNWVNQNISTENIFNITNANFIKTLRKINALVNGQKNASFRNGTMVIKSTPDSVPGFHQLKEITTYLQTHDAAFINLYYNMAKLVIDNFGQPMLRSRDSWNSVIAGVMRDKTEGYMEFLNSYYKFDNSPPQEIKTNIDVVFNGCKDSFKENPIKAAATIHQGIVNIHPFKDGNGRTARIWLNILLMNAGYPKIVFIRDFDYTEAVNKALAQNNVEIFENYIKNQICKITKVYTINSLNNANPFENLEKTCLEEGTTAFNELLKQYNF